MDEDGNTQRIPQAAEQEATQVGGLLAEASAVASAVLGTIQAIAGTTACKGVQTHALYKYAIEHGLWFENVSVLGEFSDRGSENEVYMSFDGKNVYKLNDFRYADDNLGAFFERIKVHNEYFPACAYELVGFAQNREGKVCALLKQPFVMAEREATEEEIDHALRQRGFTPCLEGEYYTNGEYDIFDALPNNVLLGMDGQLYFIDTIIYKSEESNLNMYKSLSPRYQG